MPEPGDVVLASVQFVDTGEVKVRPALVLFQELGNIVVAGITSNTRMKGISLSRKEGAIKDSVIKLNYLFTVSPAMVAKKLFALPPGKRRLVFRELSKHLRPLDK